ncbi:uncharacterized protein LOC135197830 isoform X2 [Macrobrachium nipponense]|uniref:uncharacterized protein LOC135197830 isoform X2 n=1 Tax=Macrobrachium nipponense TaxID=159736 RepID=UPI0030C82964
MAGTVAHLALLLSLLVLQGPNPCSSTSAQTCTIGGIATKEFYCGYQPPPKRKENVTRMDRCRRVKDTDPVIINCKDYTEPSQCHPKDKTNNRAVLRDILVTLLVLSLMLNSSLATYIIYLRRHHKQTTSHRQELAASAVPPVTRHGDDHLYEEIADFRMYKSPPPVPPALKATRSHESINSFYQKFPNEKEETVEGEGPSSRSTSKHKDDQYVELSPGYEMPVDAQPQGDQGGKDIPPPLRSSGDDPKELSYTESDSRFSNEAETCPVRMHRLSGAHECGDDVINLEV